MNKAFKTEEVKTVDSVEPSTPIEYAVEIVKDSSLNLTRAKEREKQIHIDELEANSSIRHEPPSPLIAPATLVVAVFVFIVLLILIQGE